MGTAPGAEHAQNLWDEAAEETDPVDHDFDADWAARGMGPQRVRILGGVYELPAEPPAKLILQKVRMEREPTRKVELSEVVDLLSTVVGRVNVEAWLDAGIGFGKLTDIMQYCMRRMGVGDQGKPPAPAAGATTGGSAASSSTGDSSAPTGDASTTPTSWTNSTTASPGATSSPTWPA